MISGYIIWIIVASLPLLYAYIYNSFRKIERYYWKKNKIMFWAFNLSYFVLSLTLMYNTKLLLSEFFHVIFPCKLKE